MQATTKTISSVIGFILLSATALIYAASPWNAAAPNASLSVDHSSWDKLLKQQISTDASGLNLFDYAGFDESQSKQLNQYIAALEDTPVNQLTKAQQIAYWINLYNAVTVQTIVNHYPVKSIKNIKFGLFSFGPWDEELVEVGDAELSLNDIEHKILRPIFKDNRIHYAVNCASIGCPNLQTDAFTATNAEALLQQAAKQFVNHPRGVEVKDDELILSSIYDWYAEDFGQNEEEVIEHLKQYAHTDLQLQLAELEEIDDYQYNWNLNQP